MAKNVTKKKTSLMQFLRQAKQELVKVTWPSRNEATMSAIMVVVMTVMAAVFLMIVDQIVAKVVGLILGLGG
ncbi:MAG: preprotein translocase subunit SecE [Desulfobulbaceae bacterium]|nr:preprotein translocase subunit SecE [Desulfobulbaceae bacterium]